MEDNKFWAIFTVCAACVLVSVFVGITTCSISSNHTLIKLAQNGCIVTPVANSQWNVDCTKGAK